MEVNAKDTQENIETTKETYLCLECKKPMKEVGIFFYCKGCNLLFSAKRYREWHPQYRA